MVYVKSLHDSNIWRIREEAPGIVSRPEPFINSTREDDNAQFSPDGRRIAFQSGRSGSVEIWVSRSDGSSPMQLTSFGGAQIGGPHWAPDSEHIVFHARPEGTSHLYVVDVNGGAVQQLTNGPARGGGTPSWSRDGRWIYFASNRTGRAEIWRMPVAGGEPTQVTTGGGAGTPLESPDGRWLYYSRLRSGLLSLCKVPVQGGPASQVLESLANSRAFFVVEEGIYFVPAPDANKRTALRFLDFDSGKARDVVPIQKRVGFGISVFPLSRGVPRTILWGQVDQDGSDLMSIENLPEGS
jgi:Tol biopolymer transport system component